jgi:hypothetical protein
MFSSLPSMSGPRVLALCAALLLAPLAPAALRPASALAAAPPTCVPSTLNRSAIIPGTTIHASPLPESRDAAPGAQISLLGIAPSQLSNVSATGSRTGRHSGRLAAYSQNDGASFVPSQKFAAGERVTVTGDVASAKGPRTFAYGFTIGVPDPLPPGPPAATALAAAATPSSDIDQFVTRPDLQPPAITVTTNSPAAAPGYIFTAPYTGPGQHGPEIFDNSGQPVWFDPLPSSVYATDVQVQSYDGAPALTFWQGAIPEQGFGEGQEIIVNSSYQIVNRVSAGNGYSADLHDFELGPDHTALMTVFNPLHCDATREGGTATAVTDAVFQQVDLATGLVRQEWHSLDHVPLTYSYQTGTTASTKWPWDAFHINSVQSLPGGNVLISSRSTWAVYELSGATGQVLWELGGKRSSFRMGRGTATAWQHDARMLPNGEISIFDNGAVPAVESQSRAIVVALNGAAHTATLVSQRTHNRPLLAGSQGNYQTLPNGDAFVGWGAQPYFSEYSPSGQLVFDARMPTADQAYRAYRYPWTGTPTTAPTAAGRIGANHLLTAYASWNGATRVAAWRVLAGPSPAALSVVATVPRTGFESSTHTSGAGPYVQVQALDAAGAVIGTSAVAKGS